MNMVKKLGSKFLAITLSLLVMCSVVQIPVHAAETVNLIDVLDGKVAEVAPGTIIAWTSANIQGYSNLSGNNTYANFRIVNSAGEQIAYLNDNKLRSSGTSTDGTYTVPSTSPDSKVTVDKWTVVSDRFSFDLVHLGYNISIDSNTGTGSMTKTYAVDGQGFTLPACTITAPEGKEFKEWAIGSADSATRKQVGETYVFTADSTIYPVWQDAPTDDYSMKISDFSINGKVGEKITPVTITLTVLSGGVPEFEINSDITPYFSALITNFPQGLSAKLVSKDDKTMTAEISGTPAESFIGTATLDSGVMPNSNCTFNIVAATSQKPTITAGAGSVHQISNSKDMTLTCSGKLEDLTGIYVDGKLVDESNYTLKSGSTILTLKASYLDTLSVGEHTLKFQYKDNVSAETNFTITKVAETPKTDTPKTDTVIKDTSTPKTGDTTATSIYIGLLALSGCAVAFAFRRRKATNK